MAAEHQKRYFELQDEKTSKFWEVTLEGVDVTVRYGKIGAAGQRQAKSLADAKAAAQHVDKLIAEKTGKGYVEAGDSVEPQPGDTAYAAVHAKASRKKAAASKAVAVKNPVQDPEASPESLMAMFDKDDATNRLLAKHPKSSPQLLEKLSHSSDKATRQAVTGNPNTPPETFIRLGQQFPKEFLANPALDLLLLVNPALMDEVPDALLIRLLKQADCPGSLLTWAASQWGEKVQLAVAMNANAPEQALQRLRDSEHQAVREAVRVKPSTKLLQDPEQAFEQAVRKRLGALKPKELLEAWSFGDIGLAQWSALPLTFRLAKSASVESSPEGLVRGLQHTGRTFEIFREIFANYLKGPVLRRVAGDASTPIPVLDALFKNISEHLWTSSALARNPSSPISVLQGLLKTNFFA